MYNYRRWFGLCQGVELRKSKSMRNSGSGWGIDWLPDDMTRTSRERDSVQLVDGDSFARFFIITIPFESSRGPPLFIG